LITKLDPRLHQELSRQGFQVTGYRLELVGYQTSPIASGVHQGPVEPGHPVPDRAATNPSVPGARKP
jgi:hypothetical protein